MRDRLISDERLAESLAIARWKGTDASVCVADRFGALAIADDGAGVERFTQIAAKLDLLQRGSVQ